MKHPALIVHANSTVLHAGIDFLRAGHRSNSNALNLCLNFVQTICMIGVVEKYKELAKFNLRQLTSPEK